MVLVMLNISEKAFARICVIIFCAITWAFITVNIADYLGY